MALHARIELARTERVNAWHTTGVKASRDGNFKLAEEMLSKAAGVGHVGAQNHLALNYALGRGLPVDYVLAYMWFSIAAAEGDPKAEKGRDLVATRLTPLQIVQAKELASEWRRLR